MNFLKRKNIQRNWWESHPHIFFLHPTIAFLTIIIGLEDYKEPTGNGFYKKYILSLLLTFKLLVGTFSENSDET